MDEEHSEPVVAVTMWSQIKFCPRCLGALNQAEGNWSCLWCGYGDEKMNEQRRITCPICGRTNTAVTQLGKLTHHNDASKKKPWLAAGEPCEGAGRKIDEF